MKNKKPKKSVNKFFSKNAGMFLYLIGFVGSVISLIITIIYMPNDPFLFINIGLGDFGFKEIESSNLAIPIIIYSVLIILTTLAFYWEVKERKNEKEIS